MNTHLDLGMNQVIEIMAGMAAMIVLMIIAIRLKVNRSSGKDLTSKYQNKAWSSPLQARAKYPDVEILQYRPMALMMGIAFALALTTTLMNWTVVKKTDTAQGFTVEMEADIEVTPPQTAEPPPPPPPPPPSMVIEVPEETVEEMEEAVEFMDQSIDAETVVDIPAPPEHKDVMPPPPPPPPAREEADEIFKVVEEMPRFPGCEDISGTTAAKKTCADKALYTFINANLKYPSQARENNIQGTVVVQFVVNRDGTIQDISILRDIGAGCGEEVIRVVNLMNQQQLHWAPGKQRGVPVRVNFILPVRFTLLGGN